MVVDYAGCRQDSGGNTLCCPVCKVTLRSGDFTSHVELELEKLSKLSRFTSLFTFHCFTFNIDCFMLNRTTDISNVTKYHFWAFQSGYFAVIALYKLLSVFCNKYINKQTTKE